MKRIVALLLVLCMAVGLAACGQKAPDPTEAPAAPAASGETAPAATEAVPEENLTETQKIIKEAQTMTLEELAKKAIEESNGKMFYGVGNSSRGKSALGLLLIGMQGDVKFVKVFGAFLRGQLKADLPVNFHKSCRFSHCRDPPYLPFFMA